MPDTFTFEEAREAPGSFTFEEAERFSFDDAQETPLRREMRAAGVNMDGDAAGAAPPRFTEDQALQAQMMAGAGRVLEPKPAPPASIGPREPSMLEDIRRSEPVRRLLGPTAVEREAMVGSPGSPGEIAGKLLQFTSQVPPPIADPIRAATDVGIDLIPHPTTRGVVRGVRELGLAVPGMLAGASIIPASKAVLGAFTADYLWHLPEQKQAFDQAMTAGDYDTAASIATQAVGMGALLTAGGVAEGIKTRNERRMADAPPEKALPDPDLIARNLAAPGTVRPTEQRAMASPIEGREKPAEVVFERLPVFNNAGEVVEVQRVPRIRELIYEEPQLIVPETRFVKPEVEGGKLPERKQGFERTAEDIIAERPAVTLDPPQSPPSRQRTEPVRETTPSVESKVSTERPAVTIEPPKAPGVETAAGERSKAAPEIAAPATPAPEPTTKSEPVSSTVVVEPTRPNGKPVESRKPGLVSDTAAEAWADRTIAEGRQRVNTGVDPELFAAYVVKGAAHIERGARDFATWARRMTAEHGDAIRPHLRSVFDAAQRGLAKTGQDEAALKQRRTAKRGSTSKQVDPEHRQRLKEDPAAFYEPQSVVNERQAVAQKTNQELAQTPVIGEAGDPNPNGVLAKLELYKRLVAAGEKDAAWNVFSELMKAGTQMGQLINQFKQLNGATADGVLLALDRRLSENGFDPLRPDDRLRIRALGGKAIQAEGRATALEEVWQKNPSPENFNALLAARRAADAAQERMAYVVRSLSPRSFWDVQIAKMQGGLMQTKSLVANIVGNVTGLGAEQYARSQAAFTDMIESTLRGLPRTSTVAPLRASNAGVREMGRSLSDVLHILKEGGTPQELSKADVMDPIKPLAAWRDVITGNISGPRIDGKIPWGQKMVLAAEMTPGAMVATAFLRSMAALDVPTRRAARGRVIVQEIKGRELNGEPKWTPEQVRQATTMPELFFDRPTLERIEQTAAQATYQQKNPVARYAQAGMSALPGPLKFMARGVMPFMNTPLNFAQRMMEYIPAFAAAKVAKHIWKGERREAHLAAGRFVLGTLVATAGTYLYQQGLLAPPLDDADEQQKGRILSGTILPPNHVNISGLQRVKDGGSPAFQPGDETLDITRAGGFLGIILATSSSIGRTAEKQPPGDPNSQLVADELIHRPLQSLSYLVDQSILRGTAELLDAVRKKEFDRWLTAYSEALISSEIPNLSAAVSRAQRDFKPVLKDEGFTKTFENVLRSRLGFTGSDKDLPLKRDLRGRPIPETPEGSNRILYQFFDITGQREIPNDGAAEHIYRLWRNTADDSVVPTPPGGSLTWKRKSYTLTPGQTSRLQELVGRERFRIVDQLVENPVFLNAPVARQAAKLREVYGRGLERGQHLFWREEGTNLEEKQKPAGFALP